MSLLVAEAFFCSNVLAGDTTLRTHSTRSARAADGGAGSVLRELTAELGGTLKATPQAASLPTSPVLNQLFSIGNEPTKEILSQALDNVPGDLAQPTFAARYVALPGLDGKEALLVVVSSVSRGEDRNIFGDVVEAVHLPVLLFKNSDRIFVGKAIKNKNASPSFDLLKTQSSLPLVELDSGLGRKLGLNDRALHQIDAIKDLIRSTPGFTFNDLRRRVPFPTPLRGLVSPGFNGIGKSLFATIANPSIVEHLATKSGLGFSPQVIRVTPVPVTKPLAADLTQPLQGIKSQAPVTAETETGPSLDTEEVEVKKVALPKVEIADNLLFIDSMEPALESALVRAVAREVISKSLEQIEPQQIQDFQRRHPQLLGAADTEVRTEGVNPSVLHEPLAQLVSALVEGKDTIEGKQAVKEPITLADLQLLGNLNILPSETTFPITSAASLQLAADGGISTTALTLTPPLQVTPEVTLANLNFPTAVQIATPIINTLVETYRTGSVPLSELSAPVTNVDLNTQYHLTVNIVTFDLLRQFNLMVKNLQQLQDLMDQMRHQLVDLVKAQVAPEDKAKVEEAIDGVLRDLSSQVRTIALAERPELNREVALAQLPTLDSDSAAATGPAATVTAAQRGVSPVVLNRIESARDGGASAFSRLDERQTAEYVLETLDRVRNGDLLKVVDDLGNPSGKALDRLVANAVTAELLTDLKTIKTLGLNPDEFDELTLRRMAEIHESHRGEGGILLKFLRTHERDTTPQKDDAALQKVAGRVKETALASARDGGDREGERILAAEERDREFRTAKQDALDIVDTLRDKATIDPDAVYKLGQLIKVNPADVSAVLWGIVNDAKEHPYVHSVARRVLEASGEASARDGGALAGALRTFIAPEVRNIVGSHPQLDGMIQTVTTAAMGRVMFPETATPELVKADLESKLPKVSGGQINLLAALVERAGAEFANKTVLANSLLEQQIAFRSATARPDQSAPEPFNPALRSEDLKARDGGRATVATTPRIIGQEALFFKDTLPATPTHTDRRSLDLLDNSI